MEENKSKRKEWVKNAAIVFLSVLLVLTFFSNTIMNYSLPEVATQYVEPGNITAKVRGSGVVESGDPYSVRLRTTSDSEASGVYDVKSVNVKQGDKVEKGQLLCTIAADENKDLEEAKNALNAKILEYEISILKGEVSDDVLANAETGNTSSLAAYQARVLAAENKVKNLKDQLKEAEDTLEAWQREKGGTVSTKKEKEKLDKAKEAYDEVADVVEAGYEKIKKWQKELDEVNEIIQDYEDDKKIVDGEGNLVPAVSEAAYQAACNNKTLLEERISNKKAEIKEDEEKLPALKKALDKAQSAYDNKASNREEDIDQKIDEWTKNVSDLTKRIEDAEEEKNKVIADVVSELSWSDALSELNKKIEKASEESVKSEIVAPISGEILSTNVRSGEETPADGILFTIQPEGKGYTMQFSVSNEQAKRLAVGDRAELVNAWRYDDVEVKLASIKPDTSDPSKRKLLKFEISGDVTAGQSLSVSVGEKNANYDMTVPNSAIREDNNGKFILTVTTKSTPLSNRYIATRVDVEVLASDDTRSAVSGALYGYEYVITTSTAPVEAGKQVRLANGS